VKPDSSKWIRLDWFAATETVDMEKAVEKPDPNPQKVAADDKLQPFTGASRTISDLDNDKRKRFPRLNQKTIRLGWTAKKSGVFIGSTLVYAMTGADKYPAVDLHPSARMEWAIQRMAIPSYVSACREDVVMLDFGKLTIAPNSNPLDDEVAPSRPVRFP
jgi:hypothetical protein